jgi:2-polyprenyl-6-hydroxyphenyl methylase/3-demethylubiquinone-9 3-methyltransferase
MAIDNAMYDTINWWDENADIALLATAINPCRYNYFKRVLGQRLRLEPGDKRVLDVCCGGGLLAEEFAKDGWRITGVDQSNASLTLAREHAKQGGLDIDYRSAKAQSLPFEDKTFDIVYCCDALEHIPDYPKAVAESSRVLKTGGLYLYETLNRTFISKIVGIKVLQDWSFTSVLAKDVHDWNMFIKPEELYAAMSQCRLQNIETRGVSVTNPIQYARGLFRYKRGEITLAGLGRRMKVSDTWDTSIGYLGFSVKTI